MKAMWSAALASVFVGMMAGGGWAQESKSAPLAKQLVSALQAAKMDTLAVRDPNGNGGAYVGVFYVPGGQLLVVSGVYSAPVWLDQRIAKKEYRDAYIDLNSASEKATRLLIEDGGADGLKAARAENQPIDAVNQGGKRMMFDSDWQRQQLTEADYLKAFGAADERYARMLTILIRALGDPSVRVAVR